MENIKIDSNVFNFQFFLAKSEIVESLQVGALKNGGATKFADKIISNFEGGEFIEINSLENEISVFIPSTMEVNSEINNSFYVETVVNKLASIYNVNNLEFYKTFGSWYSTDNKEVVVENITIVTLKTNKLSKKDINNFIEIANYLKSAMLQEGVSISINNSLAIV